MDGNSAASVGFYRDALTLLRKQLGRRKVFFDDEHGVLFLLALLGMRDAKLHSEIQSGLDAAMAVRYANLNALGALQATLWLAQGLESKARDLIGRVQKNRPTDPLSDVCILLALYVLDRDMLLAERRMMSEGFALTRKTLPLLAGFFAEFLQEALPGQDHGAAIQGEARLRLRDLLQAEPAWMRALSTLDTQRLDAVPVSIIFNTLR